MSDLGVLPRTREYYRGLPDKRLYDEIEHNANVGTWASSMRREGLALDVALTFSDVLGGVLKRFSETVVRTGVEVLRQEGAVALFVLGLSRSVRCIVSCGFEQLRNELELPRDA